MAVTGHGSETSLKTYTEYTNQEKKPEMSLALSQSCSREEVVQAKSTSKDAVEDIRIDDDELDNIMAMMEL